MATGVNRSEGQAGTAIMLPELPRDFVATASAFPAKIEKSLSQLDNIGDVKKLLAVPDVYCQLGHRLKASTEALNDIQRGRFKIIDKLGGMMIRGKPGRGKKNPAPPTGFSEHTVAAYRKVHDYAEHIDRYFDSLDGLTEASLAGFLRHVQADNRNRKASSLLDEMRRHRNMVAQHASAELLKNEVKYSCVLVDSAWHVSGDDGAEWLELGKLPIAKHTAKDAIVFVRSGGHKLAANRADTLIENWEFRPIDDGLYLQGAIEGKGRYLTKSIEEVAIGIKGNPQWPDPLPADAQQCSPDKVHELIERLTPFSQNLRLELFGRTKRPGWVSWTPGS